MGSESFEVGAWICSLQCSAVCRGAGCCRCCPGSHGPVVHGQNGEGAAGGCGGLQGRPGAAQHGLRVAVTCLWSRGSRVPQLVVPVAAEQGLGAR